MGDIYPVTRVAAVQAAPVFLNREATIEKMKGLTTEAADNGAQLVVFSESFVPTFPTWCQVISPMDQNDLYTRLYQNAVEVPSPAFFTLQDIAKQNGVYLSVGVTERGSNSMGAMWNANFIFDPEGNLIARHRKLQPTWAEKLIWSFGDGSSLNVHDTPIGRLGCLICGENTNTLARYALAAQMEQIHISTYPPCSPNNRENRGDYENVLRVRACAHSFEAKVYTIAASSVLDDEAIQAIESLDPRLEGWMAQQSFGMSFIAGPNGQIISDIIRDNQEGIVYADCDINREIWLKNLQDITGNYQRFDVFRFEVDRTPREALYYADEIVPPNRDFYPYHGDGEATEEV